MYEDSLSTSYMFKRASTHIYACTHICVSVCVLCIAHSLDSRRPTLLRKETCARASRSKLQTRKSQQHARCMKQVQQQEKQSMVETHIAITERDLQYIEYDRTYHKFITYVLCMHMLNAVRISMQATNASSYMHSGSICTTR